MTSASLRYLDVVDRINTGDHKLFKDIVKTTPKHTGHLQQLPPYCNYPPKSSIVRAIARSGIQSRQFRNRSKLNAKGGKVTSTPSIKLTLTKNFSSQ